MNRKIGSLIPIVLIYLLVLFAYPTLAQEQTGSIRGVVYRDVNANGLCTGEGEVRLANIPLEIINDDIQEIVRFITAPDGTYIQNGAALGSWQVTVVPGEGWRVTSQQTRAVVLTPENPDMAEVDFCIVEIEGSVDGGVTLPESGAPIAPQLLFAGAAGLALMVLGAGMLLHGRKARPQ